MALDATEVYVAGSGHVYTAPAGTEPPADVSIAMPATWTEHGYTNEDGVKVSFGKTVDQIKGWQTVDPLRIVVTDAPRTVSFALKQLDGLNLLLALGGGELTADTTGTRYTPPDTSFLDIRSLCIEGIDGDDLVRFTFYRVTLNAAMEMDLTRTASADMAIELAVMANNPYPFIIDMPSGDRWDGTVTAPGNGALSEPATVVTPAPAPAKIAVA